MCVAVVVESLLGPTLAELLLMEEENPDGAGLAWAEDDRVRYLKGLTADEVYKMIPWLPRPFLLHFRWATHGPKVPHLTHPFPISRDVLDSRATEGTAQSVLIHNGTWPEYWRHVPREYGFGRGLSDTQVAAFAAVDNPSVLDRVQWATAVGTAAGEGRLDVTMRGTWEDHNGDSYSNLNWHPQLGWKAYLSSYSDSRTPLGIADTREPVTRIGAPRETKAQRKARKKASKARDTTISWLKEYDEAQRALRGEK